ncbi:MAG: hypothetical protein J6Y74_05085 [Clostridia bacterium]|nr:hypothetical protein [Clostridia bacterium]
MTASAEEARTLDFSLQTVSTASEVSPATFRYISAGDTFTLTYALEANGGLDVAYPFPLYDEDAFCLTSVTIDAAWHLEEDYYLYYNETTGDEEYLTLAEHLVRFEEEYLAHHADDSVLRTYDMMSFEIYPSAFGVYPTSEAFLVLEFTARADVKDAADFVFGLDFAPTMQGGLAIATTNAARYSHYSPVDGGSAEKLLFRMRVGEEYLPMAANALETSYVAKVVPTIQAEVPADPVQEISFVDNVFPVDDVVSTVIYPATPAQGENPYLEQGGTRVLRFYLPDPEDPTLPGELMDGVPQTSGAYFVQAVYSDTEQYQGIATEIVPIIVKKEAISPDLEGFLASAPETAIPEAEKVLDITFTYGDAVSVTDADEAFDASIYDTKYYVSADGENWTPVQSDPILSEALPAVGFYKVTLEPLYPATQTFGFEEELYVILIEVEKAALTARSGSYEITYGDALPTYAYTLEGLKGNDGANDASAIRALLQATFTLDPAYDGAGEYAILLNGEDGETVLANYVVAYENGTLTVDPKSLTLFVSYAGGTATFGLKDGNNVEVAVPATYKIGASAASADSLTSNEYTAEAAYALDAAARKVWADAGKNYDISFAELAAPCLVTYDATVSGATGLPADLYLFAGQKVPVPETTPEAEHHEFLYWAVVSSVYDFSTPVAGDFTLTATFDKTEYAYAFRAAIFTDGETPALAGEMRVLTFEEGVFLLSDESATFIFRKGEAIPLASNVKYFKIEKWYKAVPQGTGYLYTEISTFTPAATSEGESGVLLVACMAFDVAEGDLNGDRVVNVEDVIRLRKYIAHYDLSAITISTVDAAWTAVKAETPEGGYFFPSAADIDHDGMGGLADAIYVVEALVSGYEYVKVTDGTVNGVYVAGERVIAREGNLLDVSDGETLEKYAYLGLSLRLTEDLLVGYVSDNGGEEETVTFDFRYDGDTFILDLGGNTVTMKRLILRAAGAIEIKNGSVICESYDIKAADGVTITDVAGLPAADGSVTEVKQN